MDDEARVLTEDVAAILQAIVGRNEDDQRESVAVLAERAGTSTRTVYRCLGRRSEFLSLDLADRLLVAAGHHLSEVRVVEPASGRI